MNKECIDPVTFECLHSNRWHEPLDAEVGSSGTSRHEGPHDQNTNIESFIHKGHISKPSGNPCIFCVW